MHERSLRSELCCRHLAIIRQTPPDPTTDKGFLRLELLSWLNSFANKARQPNGWSDKDIRPTPDLLLAHVADEIQSLYNFHYRSTFDGLALSETSGRASRWNARVTIDVDRSLGKFAQRVVVGRSKTNRAITSLTLYERTRHAELTYLHACVQDRQEGVMPPGSSPLSVQLVMQQQQQQQLYSHSPIQLYASIGFRGRDGQLKTNSRRLSVLHVAVGNNVDLSVLSRLQGSAVCANTQVVRASILGGMTHVASMKFHLGKKKIPWNSVHCNTTARMPGLKKRAYCTGIQHLYNRKGRFSILSDDHAICYCNVRENCDSQSKKLLTIFQGWLQLYCVTFCDVCEQMQLTIIAWLTGWYNN